MERSVTVACVQAEPVILDLERSSTRVLLGARQRFDPVGHYSRPDVLRLLKT